MTNDQAAVVLRAAKNDAVLAAWASVVITHRMPFCSDISPYDAWDSYQELLNYGLLEAVEFNNNHETLADFFASQPTAAEIQGVVENIRVPGDPQPQERKPLMSKPSNPFAKPPATALAHHQPNQQLSHSPQPTGHLSGFGGQGLFGEPSPQSIQMQPQANPMSMPAPTGQSQFAPGSSPAAGLPCTNVDDGTGLKGVTCASCNRPMEFTPDGGDIQPLDNAAAETYQILEAVWVATCCGQTFYLSKFSEDYRV